MRVLGLDPGYGRLGWAIVEQEGFTLRSVDFGCLETPASAPFASRLAMVHRHVTDLAEHHKVDEASVEQLYFSKNAKTAMQVAQARGAILVALDAAGVSLYEPAPNQVKQALAGTGAAGKAQIQAMVQRLLGLPKPPKPDDAADALAMAITALRTRPMRQLAAQAAAAARPLALNKALGRGRA